VYSSFGLSFWQSKLRHGHAKRLPLPNQHHPILTKIAIYFPVMVSAPSTSPPGLGGQLYSHESMSSQHKAGRVQPGLPAIPRPDRRRVVEQTVFFLLLGQPGELGVEGMIGRQERLLAIEDRWIGTDGVFLPSLYPKARSFDWNNSRGAVARL
jgi:hypothetical protein